MIPLSNILKTYILFTLATNLPELVTSQIPTSPSFATSTCHMGYVYSTRSGNYTLDDTYNRNLNLVFSDLVASAFTTHFRNTSAGPAGNSNTTAYGQYYCRGDISAKLCQNCVKAATQVATEGGYCFPMRAAVIWFYECTLWYDKESNVGIWSKTWIPWWQYSYYNVSDPTMFDQVVFPLMRRLIKKAAYGGDPLEFATGEDKLTQYDTVYGLVQCSPDIVGLTCESCLNSGLMVLSSVFVGHPQWAHLYYPNCEVMFSLAPYYYPISGAPPPSLSPPVSNDAHPSGKDGKRNVTLIVIPVAVGSMLLLCGISFCMWFCLCRKKMDTRKSSETQHQETPRDIIRDDSEIGNIECFDFRAIEDATLKFSVVNKLGQGGFGIVYKGILPGGQLVAIKRLSTDSVQGIREFKTEVAVVAKLQHRNLVRLIGFCVENEERVLVYEYLPNLSLDKILFDARKSSKLDWRTRYKIIEGIASGLRYLHIDSLLTIVHRDLKSSNILLDNDINPKIADFGMAKLVKINETSTGDTSKISGTYGYMAPEYAMAGRFSIKSDIYSFGVIILEIISGKSISHFYDPSNGDGLLQHAWSIWNERAIERLVDPTLQNKYSKEEAEKCLQIALLCIQDDATMRPTIRVVVGMLEKQSLELQSPSAPSSYLSSPSTSIIKSNTHGVEEQIHDSSSGKYFNDLYPR